METATRLTGRGGGFSESRRTRRTPPWRNGNNNGGGGGVVVVPVVVGSAGGGGGSGGGKSAVETPPRCRRRLLGRLRGRVRGGTRLNESGQVGTRVGGRSRDDTPTDVDGRPMVAGRAAEARTRTHSTPAYAPCRFGRPPQTAEKMLAGPIGVFLLVVARLSVGSRQRALGPARSLGGRVAAAAAGRYGADGAGARLALG